MSDKLVYLLTPHSNVRHYIWPKDKDNSVGSLNPYCQVICWLSPRLSTYRKGTRLCKLCKKAVKTSGKSFPPFTENAFVLALKNGLEKVYCFEI